MEREREVVVLTCILSVPCCDDDGDCDETSDLAYLFLHRDGLLSSMTFTPMHLLCLFLCLCLCLCPFVCVHVCVCVHPWLCVCACI